MKKFLLVLLALALCLGACVCLSSCKKEISEEEWRAAFAFENVRVDCTRHRSWEEEPLVGDPLYGGTHYLFDGDLAAVANAKNQYIGSDEFVTHEKLFRKREGLIRLFNFADRFGEFTRLEDGTYFCESSSLKNIMWEGDCIKDVYVTFTDGRVSKISYTYCPDSVGLIQTTVHTFTFSGYGEIVLEAPTE